MVYDGTNAQPLNLAGIGGSQNDVFYIDDWSVKVVGISSSGFETVNEPVVPQVPLMRYNQKMKFKSYS